MSTDSRTIRWHSGDIDNAPSTETVYVDRYPRRARTDVGTMMYASDLEIDGTLADLRPIEGRAYYLETGRVDSDDDVIIVELFELVDVDADEIA